MNIQAEQLEINGYETVPKVKPSLAQWFKSKRIVRVNPRIVGSDHCKQRIIRRIFCLCYIITKTKLTLFGVSILTVYSLTAQEHYN